MAWPPRCMPGYLPARARACERRCKSWEEASDRSRPAGNTIEQRLVTSMERGAIGQGIAPASPRARRRRLRFSSRFVSCRPVRPQVVMVGSKLRGWPAQPHKSRGIWAPIIEYNCMRAAEKGRARASRDIADDAVPSAQWFTHWTTVSFVPGRGHHLGAEQ